jgi:hypothetical protein
MSATHDTALPIWALELIAASPNKTHLRLRDLPDHQFNKFKKFFPRKISCVNGYLCITTAQFAQVINKYNHANNQAIATRKQLQNAVQS